MNIEWGFAIALDIFMGGLASGLFIFAVFTEFFFGDEQKKIEKVAAYLSPICLAIAMVFLFMHLGNTLNVIWILLRFNFTSPIAWGSILQTLFFFIGIFYSINVYAQSEESQNKYKKGEGSKLSQSIAGILFRLRETKLKLFDIQLGIKELTGYIGLPVALAVGIYHGVLLMTFESKPLWNSGSISVLTFCTFIATAIALLILIITIKPAYHDEIFPKLTFTRNMLILTISIQIITVIIWIVSLLFGIAEKQQAITHLMSNYVFSFWGLSVIIGMVIPFILGIKDVINTRRTGKFAYSAPVLTSLFILAGGFSLRYVIVIAAQ